MIGIIDYEVGNTKSVLNALAYIGYDAVVTRDPDTLSACSHLLLPGVGAFGEGMRNIVSLGIQDLLLKEVLENRKPILGICLGLQLLAESSSEHGYHRGLSFLPGDVVEFQLRDFSLKKTHMGWNDVNFTRSHPLLARIPFPRASFYFVHSFHLQGKQTEYQLGSTTYGYEFPSLIVKENIVAAQFHPEKSQDNGLQLLQNFCSWVP